ncbi:putative leader peptide [Actinokineospora sp. G85]
MRMLVDHTVDAWHAEPMSATEVFLVVRRHVDLRRVSSALCRDT